MSDDHGDSEYMEEGSEAGYDSEGGYSSGDGFGGYSGDEAEASSPMAKSNKKTFVVLDREELRDRLKGAVAQVVDLLCISDAEATRALRFYKWDLGKLQEEWFTDPDAVRTKVGLVDEQPGTRRAEETCKICFESYAVADMAAARCKHYYCKDCWRGYVHNAVQSGPSCLDLRCPDPECKAAVPRSVIMATADEQHKQRYEEFAVNSFVDDQRQIAWCPAPDCQNAALSLSDRLGVAQDIFCRCGAAFCFNCKEEAHRPVDCETVRQWMIKNSAESENLNWILANTKPCPKCTRPIEKNQGCMHMTCSQCKHEFCWLCTGPWAEHGERTGGFYNCNRFKKAVEKGEVDEQEQKRQHARQSLERYMHYWQRWAENDSSRKKALQQVDKFRNEQAEILGERTATPTSQLKFVTDAWMQVVHCRRILKWTYSIAYYTFEESAGASKEQRDRMAQHQEFFEFNQGQAEHYLEKLHHKVEKDLSKFLKGKPAPDADGEPSGSGEGGAAEEASSSGAGGSGAGGSGDQAAWNTFREQLIGLTDVTRLHFEKLVNEFEKGLDAALKEYDAPMEDAVSVAAKAGVAADAEATAAAAAAAAKGKAAAAAAPSRRVTRSSKRRQGGPGDDEATAMEEAAGFWQCRHCTFANQDMDATDCDVCGQPRRGAAR
ncbi:putative E3 ubiquitin-ligase ARI8 [Micractinium conductrix]|uniref:RBR-type E3 ubiquitin transferase n=1 Tax=Micractinium conductrix TaxID=554055 RepID=A0A2P6VPE1_9CHLO|nr:putative E3 ubiquitin-ligase ARI8 [Micractinium conductrix]|eukprot:PSC75961.1 putative E3 ubiquitin-ligase ARI8 [Micractinium conductrix]